MENSFKKLDISDKLRSEISEVISLLKDSRELNGFDKDGWFLFEPQEDGFVDGYEEDHFESVARLLQKCNRAMELLKKYKVIETKITEEKLPHTTLQRVYVRYDENELRKAEKDIVRPLSKGVSSSIEIITIYYNDNGEIWREPRDLYSYDSKLNNKSRIFIYLADNIPDYIPTSDIAFHIKIENPRRVNETVTRLKESLTEKLAVDGGAVIQGKQKIGYRINPEVRVERR